jgi:soluble lytic murein transglycosylase-like protein
MDEADIDARIAQLEALISSAPTAMPVTPAQPQSTSLLGRLFGSPAPSAAVLEQGRAQDELINRALLGAAPEAAGIVGGMSAGTIGRQAGGLASLIAGPYAPAVRPAFQAGGEIAGRGLGYFLGKTSSQENIDPLIGIERTAAERESEVGTEAILGAGIESAIGLAPPAMRAGGRLVETLLGPQSIKGAKQTGAKLLNQMGLTEDVLTAAVDRKNQLVAQNPKFSKLTTADLVGTDEVVAAEKLLQEQSVAGANKKLAAAPARKDLGEIATEQLKTKADDTRNALTAIYETPGIRDIKANVTNIGDKVDDVIKSTMKDPDAPLQSSVLRDQIARLKELYTPEKTYYGKFKKKITEPAVDTANVGTLHDIRSKLSAMSVARKGQMTPEQTLASKLSREVDKIIDKTPGSRTLTKTNKQWAEYKKEFVRGPLAPLQKVAPERVPSWLTQDSRRLEAWERLFGADDPIALAARKIEKAKVPGTSVESTGITSAAGERIFAKRGGEKPQGLVNILKQTVVGGAQEKGRGLLGKEIVDALQDPEKALNLIRQAPAAPQGTELLRSRAGTGTRLLTSALGGDGTVEEPTTAPTPATPSPVAQQEAEVDARIERLEKLLQGRQAATPEPSPQPEAVKVGKQNVSIPMGEKYAPPSLVKAVIQVESAGKPKAVSSKGAGGLMQLMPATAKQLGVADRFDPEQNVEGGSRYLQQMLDKYGKTDIALAAYNWGPGNVDKAIRQVKADGKRVTWANIMQAVKVPQETRLYVNKVLSKQVEA